MKVKNKIGVYGRNSIEGLNHKLLYLLEESLNNVCQNKDFSKIWIKEADSIINELHEKSNPTKYFRLIEHNGRLGLLSGNTPFYPQTAKGSLRFTPLHSKQQTKKARKYLQKRIYSPSSKNSYMATKGFLKEEFCYCQEKNGNNSLAVMLKIKSYSPLIVSSDSSFLIGE